MAIRLNNLQTSVIISGKRLKPYALVGQEVVRTDSEYPIYPAPTPKPKRRTYREVMYFPFAVICDTKKTVELQIIQKGAIMVGTRIAGAEEPSQILLEGAVPYFQYGEPVSVKALFGGPGRCHMSLIIRQMFGKRISKKALHGA